MLRTFVTYILLFGGPQVAAFQLRASEETLKRIDDGQSNCVTQLADLNWKITRELLSNETGPIVLWNPSTGPNIGDNLIGFGEKMLLERVSHKELSMCCANACGRKERTLHNTTAHPTRCDATFFSKSGFGKGQGGAVVLQGGGNWGDLYPTQEKRLKVLHMLADCCSDVLVVSFPQGIFYTDEKRMAKEALVFNKVFQKFRRRPVLLWRDRESADLGAKLYHAAQNVRTPDFALTIKPLSPRRVAHTTASIDLLIAKGKTIISQFEYEDSMKSILDMMPLKYPSITFKTSMNWDLAFDLGLMSSTWTGSDFWENRKDTAMNLLGKFSIIVTDKMHMAITSMLMNKPCVYVDNAYHKINRTFESMFDLVKPACDSDVFARPIFASSFEQAIDMALSQLPVVATSGRANKAGV